MQIKINRKKMAVTALTGAVGAGIALVPMTQAMAVSKAEYSKNENVYVRMDSEGDVTGTYVVNTFTVKEAGEITDYGDYESIQNLTGLEAIEEDKDEYTFYAEKGKFYYQGNMGEPQLPWNFETRYVLDGKEVDAEELAGAEGDLDIHLLIKENPAVANPAFYQSYLLQASFTLDNDLCEDIVAEGANMADAGANQQITFNVTPDMEEAENQVELVVSAAVTDFEMDDISINGAAMTDFPMSFASEDNQEMEQTMFIMSMEGITIPEEKTVETVVEDNRNFFQKLIDRILNHKEG